MTTFATNFCRVDFSGANYGKILAAMGLIHTNTVEMPFSYSRRAPGPRLAQRC
jgi:hypothetical protein